MSDFLQDLDLFELNIDSQTLKAIAQLLDYTVSVIDPDREPEAIASLYHLKNEIVKFKSKKGKTSSQKIVPNYKQLKYAFNANQSASEKVSGTPSLLFNKNCPPNAFPLHQNRIMQEVY